MEKTTPNARVTQRDVARKADVSIAAVSLALRNSERISKPLKEKILRIAGEMGYVRDGRLAELMAHLRKRTGQEGNGANLGVLFPASISPYPDQQSGSVRALFQSIKEEAKRSGYVVDPIYLAKDAFSASRLKQILLARGIRGVVLMPPSGDDETIFALDYADLSAVALGYDLRELEVNRVCPDYLKMLDELVEGLLAKGYRRIGVCLGGEADSASNRRLMHALDLVLRGSPAVELVPFLPASSDREEDLKSWMSAYAPEVVVGGCEAFARYEAMPSEILGDSIFVSMDSSEASDSVDLGLNHRHDLAGVYAVKAVVAGINQRECGLPQHPFITMVDSCVDGIDELETLSREGEALAVNV
ncbi:LacI family DNA-binding transcriptional regulator [Pelagicoccus mobilis]|uniref:LacI family DNA-binding transcriptional regulator n=1 Tax=Pelagicoccus mobilis TaxID=415221 RepID=A0A934RYX3_9BACT|nr:LacI family DNA-binding transcriptional regulator [Pelagicoccus mobilis]MBK1876063.1 LacI family DNA-binding transcriptional regulator [Pelagicoccus mobilis]